MVLHSKIRIALHSSENHRFRTSGALCRSMRLYLSNTRWYTVMLDADLFGHPLLVCRFGGIHNNLYGQHVVPVDPGQLAEAVRAIRKRRLAHGYNPAGKTKDPA